MMMPERKPVTDDTALLHRIGQLSGDATWTTEELQDTLREGGVDPDRLVSRVLMDVQALLDTADDQGTAPPLLVALRQYTQLPPSAIAAAMEVPVPFLSVVSRHPRAVPTRWRAELASRAERALQVDRGVVMASFDAPLPYDRAASRDEPYTADAVGHYTDILDRSGMSAADRQFWQSLAANEAS